MSTDVADTTEPSGLTSPFELPAAQTVDRAVAVRRIGLRDGLDHVGKALAQCLGVEVLDVPRKAEARIDRRRPAVQTFEGRGELHFQARLDTANQVGKRLDLLGRGVLAEDVLDDCAQVAEPHRDHVGIERDTVDGRRAPGPRVGCRTAARRHDARDEGSMSDQAETSAVGGAALASAEVGVVALDIVGVEPALELRMARVDPAVDDAERHPLAGRASGIGIVRLDLFQPVLVAELRVRGIRAPPLLFGPRRLRFGRTWRHGGHAPGPGATRHDEHQSDDQHSAIQRPAHSDRERFAPLR